MMINLFSVFDPTSYFGISFNWVILFIIFMFFPNYYYFIKSDYMNMMSMLIGEVSKMFNEVAQPNYNVLNFLCVITFLYLMITNLLGLFPFVFTSTAHLIITLGFGLILWMSFFFMGFSKNFINSMAHLVPEGSPLILSPLMVLIESVSHIIRPFTLSIRLVANMMAGHLIVGLLASISLVNFSGFMMSLIFQSVLLVLEIGVSVIQGFVFSILLLLYVLEYY